MAASASSGDKIEVSIKWGKKKLDAVAVDLGASSDEFRNTIQALTGVPAAKQKLLCKKAWSGSLKAGVGMDSTKLAAGAVVTLIGSAAKLAKAAAAPVVFVEDLPKEAMASVGAALPPGLGNGMNNICYLNSTLQCLRAVPELDAAAKAAAVAGPAASAAPAASAIARSLGGLLTEMSRKTDEDSVFPASFLKSFRDAHPMFAERAANGIPKQQDSEEFQSTLLGDLASVLTSPVPSAMPSLSPALKGSSRPANVIDTLFGIEMQTTLTCTEAEAAAASSSSSSSASSSSSSSASASASGVETTTKTEAQLKLVCNIQGGGGSTVKVNHMSEGLRLALEGTVEKRSEMLARDAVWSRKSAITKLPKYLCVQFMRFYWMAASDPKPGDPPGRKFKIKRAVAFPLNGFDVYESCAPGLQKLLSANRDKHAREEDARRAARDAAGTEAATGAKSADPSPKRAKEAGEAGADAGAEDDDDDELEASLKASMSSPSSPAPGAASSSSSSSSAASESDAFGWGVPKEFEGIYELFAVVSHAGPDAESGHYMGWVRQGEPGSGSDNWLNFDDETVAPCKSEHVAALKGSGSETGDIAYIALFRATK